MDAAIYIFVNGISGVFLGMAVLYLMMKITAFVSVERSKADDQD